jgi:hypothetical protein
MVDNNKPTTEQEFLNSLTDEKAQRFGYPSAEVYRLEHELVTLGRKLNLGDESVRGEYYATLDKALTKGWSPDMLDGQQEVMVGGKLYKEMFERYKALQAARPCRLPGDGLLDSLS